MSIGQSRAEGERKKRSKAADSAIAAVSGVRKISRLLAMLMNRRLILVCLFLAGCGTPCTKKSCYQLVEGQQFMQTVNALEKKPGTRFWVYAGSDDQYDYIYSFIGEIFPGPPNHDYLYFKIPKAELNVDGPRYSFQPENRSARGILNNPVTIYQMNQKFGIVDDSPVPLSPPTRATE
jgi:hypothetical protein